MTAGSNLLPAVLLFSTESCSHPATRTTQSNWYDANNRLLESEKDDGYTETVTEYSYDDNGNQVEKEVWIDNSFDSSETSVYNGFNQLVGVSNDYADTTYTYAPSGLRLTKTVDGEQIYFVYDGDNVIAGQSISLHYRLSSTKINYGEVYADECML